VDSKKDNEGEGDGEDNGWTLRVRSREASAKMSQEGGLPTKCHAQNAKNQEAKTPKSKEKGGKKQKGWDEGDLFRLCSCSLQGLGLYLLREKREEKRRGRRDGEEGGIYRRGGRSA
jgi:hypothetical protein